MGHSHALRERMRECGMGSGMRALGIHREGQCEREWGRVCIMGDLHALRERRRVCVMDSDMRALGIHRGGQGES